MLGRLGHAEVDDLGNGLGVLDRDEHVGGLDVSVDDRLLMRVLHAFADLLEQFQPLAGRQAVPVAVGRERLTLDVFHREVGPALDRGSGVEHLGNVRVAHDGEGLPLRLEPRHDLLAVHAELD